MAPPSCSAPGQSPPTALPLDTALLAGILGPESWDYSVFSRADFDVKTWVEEVFKTSETKDNSDAYTSGVVMKLQLLIQEINNSLNEESQKMTYGVPRVIRQAEAMRSDAVRALEQSESLRSTMKAKMSAQSVARLSRLERVKQRMEKTRQSLRETDNWTTLSTDIEEVLESGSVLLVVEKAAALQASLHALQHVADYSERRRVLDSLRDRVEVMVGPQLEKALCSLDVVSSQQLCEMLTRVGRSDRISQLFTVCLLQQLQLSWQQLHEHDDLQLVLNNLTSHMVTVWHAQVRFVKQVVPGTDSVNLLFSVFADSLLSLDPSICSCFDSAIKESSDSLLLLDGCRQTMTRFLLTLKQSAESQSVGGSESCQFEALVRCAHAPFVPQLKRYSRLQQDVLIPSLRSLLAGSSGGGGDLSTRVDVTVAAVTSLSSQLHTALDRCFSISAGCCLHHLINAFQVVYGSFCSHVNAINKQLLSSPVSVMNSDWSCLHLTLRLLQAIGELMAQTSQLEQRIVDILAKADGVAVTTESEGQPPTSPPSSSFTDASRLANLLLDADDLRLYRQMVLSVKSDDLASPLSACTNSLATLSADTLRTLLAGVISPARDMLHVLVTSFGGEGGAGGAEHLPADLPDFSFTPQECITQVGQYLMTLPQHLEPFMAQQDSNLTRALQATQLIHSAEEAAVSPSGGRVSETESGPVQLVLGCVSRAVCEECVVQVLKIEKMSATMTRQLAADLDYLCNVLDDLGQSSSASLLTLLSLLRTPLDQLLTKQPPTVSGSTDQQHLLTAVIRMRRTVDK